MFLQSGVEISWRKTTWKSESCYRRIRLVTLLNPCASRASVSIASVRAATTSAFYIALLDVISVVSEALTASASSALKAARYAIIRVLRASATLKIFLLDQLMPSFSSSRLTDWADSWPLVFVRQVTCEATCATRYWMTGVLSCFTGANSLQIDKDSCVKFIDEGKAWTFDSSYTSSTILLLIWLFTN